MEYILASNNKGKINEIKQILNIDIKTLEEVGIEEDIEEFGLTFEQNALIKAQTIGAMFPNAIIISDDSGLEVKSLNNAPGVYSKRYSGAKDNIDFENNKKLLSELEGIEDRTAAFRTVLCVYSQNNDICHIVSGRCEGTIAKAPQGENGFGYDPVFIYGGKSFADMSKSEKNEISHRACALQKLLDLGVLNV